MAAGDPQLKLESPVMLLRALLDRSRGRDQESANTHVRSEREDEDVNGPGDFDNIGRRKWVGLASLTWGESRFFCVRLTRPDLRPAERKSRHWRQGQKTIVARHLKSQVFWCPNTRPYDSCHRSLATTRDNGCRLNMTKLSGHRSSKPERPSCLEDHLGVHGLSS